MDALLWRTKRTAVVVTSGSVDEIGILAVNNATGDPEGPAAGVRHEIVRQIS